MVYRLTDEYSLFFLKFIEPRPFYGDDIWKHLSQTQVFKSWCGYAFESICLKHIAQIKKALGIQGVLSKEAAWKGGTEAQSAQIDLLIDRRDQVINLCEAKFSLGKFTIDKSGAEQLRNKINVFKTVSKTKKAIFLTMITTYGLEKNQYAAALVQNEVTLEELFE